MIQYLQVRVTTWKKTSQPEFWRLTHPLPQVVLTSSKIDTKHSGPGTTLTRLGWITVGWGQYHLR